MGGGSCPSFGITSSVPGGEADSMGGSCRSLGIISSVPPINSHFASGGVSVNIMFPLLSMHLYNLAALATVAKEIRTHSVKTIRLILAPSQFNFKDSNGHCYIL